ncbi:uncharacterized protein LOC132202498 [Neocloeon triangulifer]|uniref:uncharacterized protein LOC132202498 n=1 Tax=Neocloeon triangulifer TaxID=2078957 RepID=UPI00286ED50A|nr:uncharacterized protein LOC132202498 [Neocloeon triangulifer]
MVPLGLVLLLLVSNSRGFIPIGATEGNFQPSTWTAESAPAPAQAPAAPEPARPQGRAYGGSRLKHGYGKPAPHKVDLGLDPEKIILKCKVSEPLEHIIWIRSKCPNDHYDGGHLVAEGATVQDKTLYDVRILGGNSSITSELQLKKPLDPATSGFFRCEAWPHGGGGPPYGQNVAQDVYVIGGPDMLRRCFGGWDEPSTTHHGGYDSWNAKHRSNENGNGITPPTPTTPAPSSSKHHYYVPQYKRGPPADMRPSGSHDVSEVSPVRVPQQQHHGWQRNAEVEKNTRAPIMTHTGGYHPTRHHQVQVTTTSTTTTTAPPETQPLHQPAPLPPKNYIAATPFIPSLPFSQSLLMQSSRQQVMTTTTTEAAPENRTTPWDIEDLMRVYPNYHDKNRKGKSVTEDVIIVTPQPSTAH